MPHVQPKHILERNANLRILIIRLSTLSGVLLMSPVARALREAFPHAHIGWLVEPHAEPFVRANPYVDDCIVFEHRARWTRFLREGKARALWGELRGFSAQLRACRFDITIDGDGSALSGMLARCSGVKWRIGPSTAASRRLFVTDPVQLPIHPTRLTQSMLTLVSPLGIQAMPTRPVLEIPERERLAARDFLEARGIVQEPYAACCVATSRPETGWVWSRWGKLAETLREREELRTVFVGGPERRIDALGLVEGCAAKPVSAVGHTSIQQSAAIVQGATLVVGGDTGLSYAGLATDTPTILLYGASDPSCLAEEPAVAVCYHPQPCSPCHRRPTCTRYDCMRHIIAHEVADTASLVLKRIRQAV